MKINSLDLHGMPELFRLLKKETLIDVPSYLNNHPMLDDRIQYTNEIATKQLAFQENKVLKIQFKKIKNLLKQHVLKEKHTETDE